MSLLTDLLTSASPPALMLAFQFIPGYVMYRPAPSGYQVSRSLRLRAASSTKLQRTPAGAGAVKKWTLSFWVKRLKPGAHCNLFGAGTGGNNTFSLTIRNDDFMDAYDYNSGYNARLITNQVFRDPTAWMHVLVGWDTDNATASSRFYLEINGSRVSSFSTATYPSLGFAGGYVNSAVPHMIAARGGAPEYGDFYIAEFNFIDGSALTSSDFGQVDPVTGAWVPVNPVGLTYGTNGCYLPFSDNSALTVSSNAGIGKDFSGNGNYWPTTNLSVTPGIGNDSVTDSPTNYGSDTGAGGEVRGNYATLDPLSRVAATITDGNLRTASSTTFNPSRATIEFDSGAYYAEMTCGVASGATNGYGIGVALTSQYPTPNCQAAGAYALYIASSALRYNSGSSAANSIGAAAAGDTLQLFYDGSTGNLWIGKNNVWADSSGGTTGNPSARTNPTFALGSAKVIPLFDVVLSGTYANVNFGQRPFTYAAPTGGKALCTQNLADPAILLPGQYMNVLTWTGNGASPRGFTGLGFQPDLVWGKIRSAVGQNVLYDSVRGAGSGKVLITEKADFEGGVTGYFDSVYGYLSSLDADGFTATSGSSSIAYWNTNAATYVAWGWKKGAVPGLDVVSYTGNGAARTIAHSLGAAPAFMLVKSRTTSQNWSGYHASIGAGNYLTLNSNAAQAAASTVWNATDPTSSVFSVGTDNTTNKNGDLYSAYLFAEVPGFSKFGKYTGNGSADGPFVWCNFRPRYVMVKRADSTGDWYIWDAVRDGGTNPFGSQLLADSNAAEASSVPDLDDLANGFKLRDTTAGFNASGGIYIFAAFAEAPFKNARAR